MPDSRGERRAPDAPASEIDVPNLDPAAAIARHQRGVVTRRQLRAAGLTSRAIDYRLRTGRLHRIHRGAYLVGHPVAPRLAAETAALLVCGPDSVLSHRAAARIWEISDRAESEIDVTVGRPIRSRPGLRVHRASLDRRDLRTHDGLLVTAPERTILDLASSTTRDELALALNEARGKRIVRERYLLSLLDRFPRRRGTRALRALLAAERGPLVTRSEAERRMLELIRRAGLPRPAVNSRIAGYEVDLLWPDHGLVLEVDGYAFHSRPADFERDRRREQDLAAAGLRVSRVTWLQIVDEPAAVVARLAGALARVL